MCDPPEAQRLQILSEVNEFTDTQLPFFSENITVKKKPWLLGTTDFDNHARMIMNINRRALGKNILTDISHFCSLVLKSSFEHKLKKCHLGRFCPELLQFSKK